jgi:hypothetical protein
VPREQVSAAVSPFELLRRKIQIQCALVFENVELLVNFIALLLTAFLFKLLSRIEISVAEYVCARDESLHDYNFQKNTDQKLM